MGSISVVIGVFFGDKMASSELLGWMRGSVSTVMWGSGLMVLALCFLLNPKQYSIYPDSLVVERWYFRRKVIPFEEMTELKAWTNGGGEDFRCGAGAKGNSAGGEGRRAGKPATGNGPVQGHD